MRIECMMTYIFYRQAPSIILQCKRVTAKPREMNLKRGRLQKIVIVKAQRINPLIPFQGFRPHALQALIP